MLAPFSSRLDSIERFVDIDVSFGMTFLFDTILNVVSRKLYVDDVVE